MKIASWNVNSLRVRLPHVQQWLDSVRPDVLALQEIKLTDSDFPANAFADMGYQAICSGQPTYNGVALLSRDEPDDIVIGLPDFQDPQRLCARSLRAQRPEPGLGQVPLQTRLALTVGRLAAEAAQGTTAAGDAG